MGVLFYRVYRDGAALGTSPTASYTDTGLTAGTTYSYAVQSVDAAGQESTWSTLASATTPAVPPVSGDLWLGFGFEETSGIQVLDSSTHGHQGTLTAGALRSASGRTGRAAEFTGDGGLVSLGNLDMPGSAMTLMSSVSGG